MKLRSNWTVLAAAFALAASSHGADRPLKSVGVTVGDLGNPFFVQIAKGAEAKAREIGGPDLRFSALSSGYDLNLQVNQMEDFMAARVDLIILGAADSRGIAPAVKKARKAGITVVAVDVAVDGDVDATVMSDNVQAGGLAAEFIAEKLGGKGNIVIINGPPVSAVIDRLAGAERVFQKHPDLKILSRDQNGGGNRVGGMSVMADLLTVNPAINAVFAVNDPSALGAALAIRQARRGGIMVVGVDGAPDAVKALKDPNSPLMATSAQDPFSMAVKAIEIGYQAMQGRPSDPARVLVPVALVTRQNVAEYRGWTKN